MTQQEQTTQGAAFGPPLLDLKRIVALTDAAQGLFKNLYDMERMTRRANKARLKAELNKLDLFGPQSHYCDVQDYTPSGRASAKSSDARFLIT